MKCHRFEREDSFARFVHRLNLFLEPTRGTHRTELAERVDQHRYGVGVLRCHSANLADKAAAADVETSVANTNNVIGRGDVAAGKKPQGDITDASGAIDERSVPDRRVLDTGGVMIERHIADGRVEAAGRVAKKG